MYYQYIIEIEVWDDTTFRWVWKKFWSGNSFIAAMFNCIKAGSTGSGYYKLERRKYL